MVFVEWPFWGAIWFGAWFGTRQFLPDTGLWPFAWFLFLGLIATLVTALLFGSVNSWLNQGSSARVNDQATIGTWLAGFIWFSTFCMFIGPWIIGAKLSAFVPATSYFTTVPGLLFGFGAGVLGLPLRLYCRMQGG